MRRLPITRTFKVYNYSLSYYNFETKEVMYKEVSLNFEAKKPEDFNHYCDGRPLEYELKGIDLAKRGMSYDTFVNNSELISVTNTK